jgi:hypothetical protein
MPSAHESQVMNPFEFLKISIDLQIAVGCGYAAYMLAYSGHRRSMTDFDRVFSTITFSAVASIVIFAAHRFGMWIYAPVAFFTSVIIALAWRRIMRKFVVNFLRALDITCSDEHTSALNTISQGTDNYISQVSVLLDDGTWLRCDDATSFSDSPFGPCIIGEGGDVALYLTHEELKDQAEKKQDTVRDSYWGDRITYVPAGRVKMINLRLKPKISRSSKAAVGALPEKP